MNKVQLKVVSVKNATTTDFSFNDASKLTKQIGQFLDKQTGRVTIHMSGITFDISGANGSNTNKWERTQTMLQGLLQVAFTGVEKKTDIKKHWIAENLSQSFKVPALSLNCFTVIVGTINGIYRDTVKTQKLNTEIMNKPIFTARVKTQAELKATIENHRKAFPLLDAPKTESKPKVEKTPEPVTVE